jgi:hypothetical protein
MNVKVSFTTLEQAFEEVTARHPNLGARAAFYEGAKVALFVASVGDDAQREQLTTDLTRNVKESKT